MGYPAGQCIDCGNAFPEPEIAWEGARCLTCAWKFIWAQTGLEAPPLPRPEGSKTAPTPEPEPEPGDRKLKF